MTDRTLHRSKRVASTAPHRDPAFIRAMIVSGQYTRERACDTKVRFGQYHHIAKAMKDLEARHGDPGKLQCYACPFCGTWHLATAEDFKDAR